VLISYEIVLNNLGTYNGNASVERFMMSPLDISEASDIPIELENS
jgi:hypothetical protein